MYRYLKYLRFMYQCIQKPAYQTDISNGLHERTYATGYPHPNCNARNS